MNMENQTAVQENPIKTFFKGGAVQEKFKEILGAKATGFITSVLQCVLSNKNLAECDPQSVYGAAATAAVLDLPINQNLGFAYIVPYNETLPDKRKVKVAQFQMGYKGFIQLAQRSGQFQTLSATPIYEGQLKSANPLLGYEFDFTTKTSDRIIGYAAYFRLTNGFEKLLYMDMVELNKHGKRYSKTFDHQNGRWATDFEAMAMKTVIKMLLSKYAPLSIEMQRAVITDQAKISTIDGEVEYPDNEDEESQPINREAERTKLMIENAKDLNQLKGLEKDAEKHNLMALFNSKYDELGGK